MKEVKPMACCGQNNQPTPGAQPAAMSAAFSLADVPENMVLVEYTGTNYGSTLWGGPGATPSRRQYTFGGSDSDRVKYVDQRDVDYFLNLRENTKPIFKRYEEPAQPAAAPAPAGDELGKDAAAKDAGTTQAVNPGNMDQAPAPTVTEEVADPLTASIVDPAKPTVTSEVKEEPIPDEAPKVAPKKASKK